jgi:hypothetical protein
VQVGNSVADRHSPAQGTPMVGNRAAGNRAAGNRAAGNRAPGNQAAGNPMMGSPVVGTRVDRIRAADSPVPGNPGNPGNRAAARSPGGATVVVDHGSHTVDHRVISQRAAMPAGLDV